MKTNRIRWIVLVIAIGAIGGVLAAYRIRSKPDANAPLSTVVTIAGSPLGADGVRFEDPFGIAVSPDGDLYVTDGEMGRLWQIKADGSARVIAENLETPSGLAISPDSSIVVAETGAHVVRRIYPTDGRSEVLGGIAGRAGFLDGSQAEALFNGPIGVVVRDDGNVYVADTYNDRVREIAKDGRVRTIAGGDRAGFADSQNGTEALFNTPCGIAFAPDGALIVADTGNHRIRRIEKNGSVRTLAGTGEASSDDGLLFAASFNEPVGVAIDKDGTIYVADSNGSSLRSCGWNLYPRVWTLVGGTGAGFQDGEVANARINHPTGIALASDGSVLFADNGNKIVRSIRGNGQGRGSELPSNALASLWPTASGIRSAAPPRWPYEPPDRPREIAATFGEIRGEVTESNKEAWFHNGLDIPGTYGEIVRAVRDERVLNPLSVRDVGTSRERIRFPMLGYIHLRIGRDVNDIFSDEAKFVVQRDSDGRIATLRVRRGTKFAAGEMIGTLNNQNHVHLTAGSVGNEINAIAALDLPGIKDTIAPVIEQDGVHLFDSRWREFQDTDTDGRINISGDVRIVVRAYDQMDGNASRRRLGVYRLGYQLLGTDGGTPAQEFEEPRVTISFERLPLDENAAQLAYASGSRSGATGVTAFAYIVTNVVRDTEARDAFFSTSTFPAGDYTLRVFAEDFFGNRTTQDIQVHIIS
jgi:DNA-binding beta-propeller fold protein YncE